MEFYLKIKWINDHEDCPLYYFLEVNADRMEMRKVEIHREGELWFAGRNREFGDTFLGPMAVPTIKEMNSEREFDATEISKEEFEKIWEKAVAQADED